MSNAFENVLSSRERDRGYLIGNLFGNDRNFENEVNVKIAECDENSCLLNEKDLLKSLMIATEYSQLSVEERDYLEGRVFDVMKKRKAVDEHWETDANRAGFSSVEEYREHLKDNDL